MKDGLEKEDEIEQALLKYMKQNGHSYIRVEKCGFVISKTHGHSGVSQIELCMISLSLAQVWLK